MRLPGRISRKEELGYMGKGRRSIGFNKVWRGVDELVDGFVWACKILYQKFSGCNVNLFLSPQLTENL
jgi:hypothetical protein